MLNQLHTLFFEAIADPGAGGGEPAVSDGEPAGESWAGPSQEEWQQTVSALGYLAEQEEARAAAAAQEGGGENAMPDPYSDPEAFQAWIDGRVDERTAPFSEFTEQARHSEADQRALDIIADLEAEGGDFLGKAAEGEQLAIDSRKVARTLADTFYPEAKQRYGEGPQAAEAALSKAVETVRALEETIGKAYATRQQNQLHTLAGVRREPAAAGTQGTGEIAPRGGDEFDVLRRYAPIR